MGKQRQCNFCGESFVTGLYKRRFCAPVCFASYRRAYGRQRRGVLKVPDAIVKCVVCKRDVRQIRGHSKMYCSKSCQFKVENVKRAAYLQAYRQRPERKRSHSKQMCRQHQRLKNDPKYRLDRYAGQAIWSVLKGRNLDSSLFAELGYTKVDLISHLERYFSSSNKFSWSNYGRVWHVDHFVPKSWFKYTDMSSPYFRVCWGLHNLRPSLGKLNNKKINLYVGAHYNLTPAPPPP